MRIACVVQDKNLLKAEKSIKTTWKYMGLAVQCTPSVGLFCFRVSISQKLVKRAFHFLAP